MSTTLRHRDDQSVQPGSTAVPGSHGPAWLAGVQIPVIVAVLLTVLVAAFAWPALNSAPRGVDLAVVAPAPVAGQIEAQLAAGAGEDAFDVTVIEDRAAAEQAIRGREVYGALVVGPQGGEALVATAASPAVAQLLTQLANGIPAEAGGPLPVTDVVPLPADDPRGVGLAVGLLPLIGGGVALGALTALRVTGRWARPAVILVGSLVSGLVVVGLLQGWLGALDGGYWTTSMVASLLILAISATVTGLHRVLGMAGVGLAVLVMVVLGNPLSGVSSAPELLPAGWGAFGQWLPPGAGATAVRSVALFDGAGAGMALLVLAVWALVGLGLGLLPGRSVAVEGTD